MAVKLTLTEALDLLAKAGVQAVEIVEKAEESDYVTTAKAAEPVTSDTLLVAIDASRESIIAPKILHAKTGELQTAITGKINGSLRSQLSQKTGIPLADLKDLNSQDAIQKAYDFYANTLGVDKQELIKERDEMMKSHAADKATAIKEKDTEIDGWKNKYTEKEIIAKLVVDHNEAKGLPPNANKAALAKQFKSHLDGKAIVKYNEEKDEVELYDKSKPELRLYASDSKVNYAKPADFLKPYYSDLGIWNEDNRNINPADEMAKRQQQGYKPVTVDKTGKAVDPVQAKIDAMTAYVPKV